MGKGRHTSGRHARSGIPSRGLFLSLSVVPTRVRRTLRRVNRMTVAAGLGAVIVAGAGLAIASHTDPFIDLASAPAGDVTHDGARFLQGGVGAGTGQFDPFVTANPQGNPELESAITVCQDDPDCPAPQFDTHLGGDRTHHLNLAAIPELLVDDVLYREFSLDANDQGNDDFMSIDDIRIYLDTQKDAGGFDPNGGGPGIGTFSINDDAAPFNVYDLDVPILMRSQTFTPGSGVSDITVLVPTTAFTTPEDCSYGSGDCIHFVYFYFEAGGFNDTGITMPPGLENKDWDISSGFEEWRTRLLPVVDVEKDAVETFERDFDWTVTKEVSLSNQGPWIEAETVDLFNGDSDTVYWRINVDKSDPIDSGASVSGMITITNPTGGDLIASDITATINSVNDVISGVGPVEPECGVTFPHDLGAQEMLICTYESALPDTDPRVNTATVNIEDDLGGDNDYEATADIDFTGVSPTTTDDTADLTDELLEIDEQVNADVVDRIVSITVTCDDDEGTIVNTALITETDSQDSDEDDASVTVNCHELDVTKDADPSFGRTFDWDIVKTVSVDDGATFVDAAEVDLFFGDDVDVIWKIEVDKGEEQDSGFTVDGTITITNTAPIDAVDVSVADVISPAISATIDCGDGPGDTLVTVLANDSSECTYSADLPDDATRTNTATATLFGEEYTGQASVDFTGVQPTVTDDTADVTDARLAGLEGQYGADGMDTEPETLNCDDHEGENVNLAILTEVDSTETSQDDASVTITCHGLTVEKDADPSFNRTFDWDVVKTVSIDGGTNYVDAADVDLFVGEDVDVKWKIVVTKGQAQDSDYAVSGTITITNDAPIAANGVSVADEITGGINAVVDCGDGAPDTSVDVPANGSAQCTYTADLPDDATRTNTATATLFGEDYTGVASVDFTGVTPTTTDDTADLTDARLPSVDQQFGNSGMDIVDETLDCDDEGVNVNTAVLTETDNGTVHDDDASVTITCGELIVTKDADPSFDRDWTWEIDKNADQTLFEINQDGSVTINYDVDVSATHVDSNWAVTGTIMIQNTADIAANGVVVTDTITGGVAVVLNCGDGAGDDTLDIPANSTGQCTYSASLPDGTTRTNTATATIAGTPSQGQATIDFTGVTPTETDETVDVTDSFAGFLGQLTASLPDPFTHTFEYSRTVDGVDLECGENLIENTATFVTTDTQTQGSADEDVTIIVNCLVFQGCTPGFWQGGVGFDLWDMANDPDFPPSGGNGGFTHEVLFNDWFTSVPELDGLSLFDLVDRGGGRDHERKAARSLVAAYLNALADGVNYEYSTAQLEALWDDAVTNGTFLELHTDLDEKNNLGADLCGLKTVEEASSVGIAALGVLAMVLASAGIRGRHARRDEIVEG